METIDLAPLIAEVFPLTDRLLKYMINGQPFIVLNAVCDQRGTTDSEVVSLGGIGTGTTLWLCVYWIETCVDKWKCQCNVKNTYVPRYTHV